MKLLLSKKTTGSHLYEIIAGGDIVLLRAVYDAQSLLNNEQRHSTDDKAWNKAFVSFKEVVDSRKPWMKGTPAGFSFNQGE